MKVDDVVMFIDKGRYAKHFLGRLGTVRHVAVSSANKMYCRVEWLQRVPYHGKLVTVSDFPACNFEVIND